MHRTVRFGVGFIILIFILLWQPGGEAPVFAQTAVPTPQKVIATAQLVMPEGSDCPGQTYDLRLEVWNVGVAGGDQYSAAEMTATGYDCVNDEPEKTLKTSHYAGTFSGGPDGKARLNLIILNNEPYNGNEADYDIELRFVDGVRVESQLTVDLIVQNPEAFWGAEPPTVTPTPGKGCSPVVGGLSGLKPGDTLSPSVQFVDADGLPVAPLSAVWYINGIQMSSVTWNGDAVNLELQYTCPDHLAHNQGYSVPAYNWETAPVVPPPADQSNNPPPAQPGNPPVAPPDNPVSIPGGFNPGLLVIPVIAVGGFVAVAAVVGGALIINGIRKAAPAPPTPRPAPAQTAPAPAQAAPVQAPPSEAPPVAPTQTAPAPPSQTPTTAPTSTTPEPAVQSGPAVELPPLASEPAPAQPPAEAPQPKAEPTEGDEPPKSPFEAAKDAAEQYVKELDKNDKWIETIKDQLENDTQLSPETREAIKKQLTSFTNTKDKIKDLIDHVNEHVENLADFQEKIKSLKREMKELAETHAQTLKDLKDLPPGPAHAFADLAVVIDAAGRGAEVLVGKLPHGEKLVKAYEIKESVQQGIKGMGKAVKVWNTSNTEAKGLSDGGKDPVPGYDPEKGYTDEIIKIHNEAVKNQPPGFIDKAKEWLNWLAGEKHVDPSQIKFR